MNRTYWPYLVFLITTIVSAHSACATPSDRIKFDQTHHGHHKHIKLPNFPPRVQLGPRPFFLVDDMNPSPLKHALQRCANKPMRSSRFSIAHRGAPLQFPEHTKESYTAAARMGAGIQECDVTFTKDMELVCRHSQCDLHTTTDILLRPELAEKCTQPFQPADPENDIPASARCCTSDITLEEFQSLCGKMDAFDPWASTAEEFVQGTADFRTDLYSQCATLMTHKESIELFRSFGSQFTPELKAPEVDMPFNGVFSQEDYAQKLVDEYREAGIAPWDIFAQSFNLNDVLYWINNTPGIGYNAVYLDDRYDTDPDFAPTLENFLELKRAGVRTVAPPIWVLLSLNDQDQIVPSQYARLAQQADLDIITWTLERSGPLNTGGGWYYQGVNEAINNDGDMYEVLHVLAQDVGVKGVFSDWPSTVTYYANCMNLK